jgi:hypothetical protein
MSISPYILLGGVTESIPVGEEKKEEILMVLIGSLF